MKSPGFFLPFTGHNASYIELTSITFKTNWVVTMVEKVVSSG